jgi:competence protein ComEC
MPRSAWLAVGAVVGAAAASLGDPRLVVASLAAAAVGSAAAIAVRHERRPRLITLAIGAAAVVGRSVLFPTGAVAEGMPDGSGPWRMVVESVGSPREGNQVATLHTVPGASPGFRLAATLPRYPEIAPGDEIDVEGRARPRPESPYGAYLARLGAWGTLDARQLVIVGRPATPAALLERVRRDTGDLLTRVLPEPEAGLAAGILIGLRDRVDRDVATAFTTAGVSHVVAISGWNIAIVAAAIAALAGRLGRRRRSIVTAVAIVAYIAFAGASPSVLRAGAMAGVVLFARESGRAGRAAAALGWAAALLLVADPGLIGDAGFQLSSLATAGLIAWASPVTQWLDRRTRGHLPRWLTESLGVSFAAQLATLPVVLASFGRLAVVAPAVNLLVVPIVAPAMAAGLVAMGGGALDAAGAPDVVGAVLAAPAWVALRLMIAIVDAAAGVPFASIQLHPAVGLAVAAGTSVAMLAAAAWHRTGRSMPQPGGRRTGHDDPGGGAEREPPRAPRPIALRIASAGLVVAVTVVGGVALARPAGVPRITVLDVGQGDAILVEGSRGGRLLVDGGPDPDRLLVQLDRRIPPWDRRLDAVVLTHPHEDHVAGLALLLARYRVGRVLEPGMHGPGPGYAAWAERLAHDGAPPHLSIAAGDRLSVDEIALRVLWPIRGRVPLEPPDTGTGINNVSVVLLGTVGPRRFLLAGDVEQDIDPSLLAEGLPRLDFLKVAHHGSRTATTQPFVDAVRPRVAVASAGAGNPYGHPARATLDRLAASGARVYRTDRDGTVVVSFEPTAMTVHSEPRRAAEVSPPVTVAKTAVAALTGPRRGFGCAIPIARTGSPGLASAPAPARKLPPAARTDPRRVTRSDGYHPGDGSQRPDRALDDRPAAVCLGRRRARGRAAGGTVRGGLGAGPRRRAGALGSARRSRHGPERRGAALRAAGDAGHVRRRDAGDRHQPGRAGPPQ